MVELIPVLQTAIGPVILISGIGLLVLSMTNRLGRAIDRTRQLGAGADPARGEQLRILWRRARVLRTAITLAVGSALAAALLVIVIFVAAMLGAEAGMLIAGLFTLGMLALILSLVLFIYDLNQSLAALKLELERHELDDL